MTNLRKESSSVVQWTEARQLHLIEAVTTVTADLWREGKADRSFAAERWEKVAAQLPRALFGEISRDYLLKSSRNQFSKLLSKRRGVLKRNYKKLSVNVSAKLDDYDQLLSTFRCISRSRAVKTSCRAYDLRSRKSHGQSKVQQLEQASAESAQSLSDVERPPEVDPIVDAARDTEEDHNSRGKAPLQENLADDLTTFSTQNTESATQSTEGSLEHGVLNDKLERFLEGADEKFYKLICWHREFAKKTIGVSCQDNMRVIKSSRRSNDHPENYKELIADCKLRKYVSKIQLQCEDLKLSVLEFAWRLQGN